MIVILKQGTPAEAVQRVVDRVTKDGLEINLSEGTECTVLGLLGDTSAIDMEAISILPGVEKVMKVTEPYKKASRKFHPEGSAIPVLGSEIGGDDLTIIAGPCSVESEEQILAVARSVKKFGATVLRGGAFKPRSSPYAFQGLELLGLELLEKAKAETNLPIVSEIMSPKHIEIFANNVDIIQIGARNMQNFDLLKEVGRCNKPVLLKRGLSSTIEEWLMSAEYILAGGNKNVILCERGIRTFEAYTRNTLDLSAIPAIKKLSHLPVIVDPSHAAGLSYMVEPLSMAAVAAGADGLIIEVHNDPMHALCDGPQSITPAQFEELMTKLAPIADAVGRRIKRHLCQRSQATVPNQ